MREILFRGKRVDNGEWVYGCLVHGAFFKAKDNSDIPYIFNIDDVDYDDFEDFAEGRGYYEVYPETVVQYTGLTDKNGKKIFEGDILAVEQISDSIEHFESPVKCPYNVVVKWDKCSWMWETIGTARKCYLHFPEAWLFRKCEVIGNATDNPELLEVRE